MVIDDDEFVRRSVEKRLLREEHTVLLASNGARGVEVAIESKPAVIFLDLRMPGESGLSVLAQLAASSVHASVIVMSGNGEVDEVIAALRLGVVDYLKKPWTTVEFTAALGRAIEVYHTLTETEPGGG